VEPRAVVLVASICFFLGRASASGKRHSPSAIRCLRGAALHPPVPPPRSQCERLVNAASGTPNTQPRAVNGMEHTEGHLSRSPTRADGTGLGHVGDPLRGERSQLPSGPAAPRPPPARC
jgi:hypothetical protein